MDTTPNAAPRPGGGDHTAAAGAPLPRPRRALRDRLLGGLILALPFLITIWVIHWLYSMLEKNVIDPVGAVVLWKLDLATSSTELPYWFETYAAPVIAILVVLAMLVLVDVLAETRLRCAFNWLITRVPVISHIYNPVRQVFQSLEKQPGEQGPQRLVLVKFPHPGIKLPAFVTAQCRDIVTQKVMLCVYVPTTPVPTSGFFLIVPEEEVTELNWSSEQALQAIMSGGLASPAEISFYKVKPRAAPAPGDGAALPPAGAQTPA